MEGSWKRVEGFVHVCLRLGFGICMYVYTLCSVVLYNDVDDKDCIKPITKSLSVHDPILSRKKDHLFHHLREGFLYGVYWVVVLPNGQVRVTR